MRNRNLLLLGILIALILVVLGPGLLARRGATICTTNAIDCGEGLHYTAPDNRVAGNAGDLIAIYCQPEYHAVQVYTVVDGAGQFLASFEASAIQAAGANGIINDLGEHGVVSIKLLARDSYYVTVQGGAIAAAGQHFYAKLFDCAL